MQPLLQPLPETRLWIEGGVPLVGTVDIIGAKNAALPALAAACLSATPTTLHNIPTRLKDVELLITLLRDAGASVEPVGPSSLRIDGRNWRGRAIDAFRASKLRHSLLMLGVSAFYGRPLSLGQSGGCSIGERKHDLHAQGFTALGLKVTDTEQQLGISGRMHQRSEARTIFHYPSFGATLNFIFAALGRSGPSLLRQAALNPEVQDIIQLLRQMGARLHWVNERDLHIEGGHQLNGVEYAICGDRIVAATYLAAAAMTKGRITTRGVNSRYLSHEIAVWQQAGLRISTSEDTLTAEAGGTLLPVDIRTSAYPGFHTDMQPLHGALMACAEGESRIIETIVDNRFRYCTQLNRMGADIRIEQGGFACANGALGSMAIIRGVAALQAAQVEATDIRGAAAVLLAALATPGASCISNLYQLDRGYAGIEADLTRLGARITRTTA